MYICWWNIVTKTNFGAKIVCFTFLNDVDTQSTAPSANKVLAYTGAEWAPMDLDIMLTDINLTTATIGTANLSDLSVDFGTILD